MTRSANGADQVGNGIAVLADGQPGQFHASRFVPCLSGRGVEFFVNELGNQQGVIADTRSGFILGHGFANVFGQFANRAVAYQRIGIAAGFPFPCHSMTRRAFRLINRLTRRQGVVREHEVWKKAPGQQQQRDQES